MSLPSINDVILRMVEDKELPAYKIASYLGVPLTEVDPIVASIREERQLSREEGLIGMLDDKDGE